MEKGIIQRCALLPVNVIATALGFATLSNMWAATGFPGVRIVTMVLVSLVWLAAIIKMTVHYSAFKADYLLLIPSSLYAAFSMLTMLIGAFVFEYVPVAGQVIWLGGVLFHSVHLCIFTFRFVIKGVILDTFLPTWFVTYMGIMTAVVSGGPLGFPVILEAIMLYGFIVYPIILLGMLIRLYKKPLPEVLKPTGAVFLAPSSLFFVSYLNMTPEPIDAVVIGVYFIVFVTIVRIAMLMPGYLRNPFGPGIAAVTFPSAIALVATFRMVGYLNATARPEIAELLRNFFGVQLFFTTAAIVYVGYNFWALFMESYAPAAKTAASNFDAAKLS